MRRLFPTVCFSGVRLLPLMLLLLLGATIACQRPPGSSLGAVERLTSETSRLVRYNAPYYVAITTLPGGGAVVAWMKDESPFRPIVFRRAERANGPFDAEQYLSPEAFRRTISIVPSLHRDAAVGEIYAIWQARNPTKGDKFVLFRKSRDDGRTWSEARTLNTETTVFVPVLASDGDGGVYVAWPDERARPMQIFFNRSRDGGDTWLPAEVRVDAEVGSAKDVVIASDGAGSVLLVWEQQKRRRAIMAAVSKDHGTTWTVPIQIDDGTGTGSPIKPQVALVGGRAVVAWTTGITGEVVVGEVWADVSSDGGITWGKDVLLHRSRGGLVSSPQLLSEGGIVQLAFGAARENRDSAVYHLTLRSDGEWSAHGESLEPVSVGEGQFRSPRLARDANGVSFLVYTDADARVLLSSSKDGGARWKTPTVVYERADANTRLHFPQVAAADGVAYVLWEEWSAVEGQAKTLTAVGKKEQPIDLYVRRVIERD